jgi:hypothetical protein
MKDIKEAHNDCRRVLKKVDQHFRTQTIKILIFKRPDLICLNRSINNRMIVQICVNLRLAKREEKVPRIKARNNIKKMILLLVNLE